MERLKWLFRFVIGGAIFGAVGVTLGDLVIQAIEYVSKLPFWAELLKTTWGFGLVAGAASGFVIWLLSLTVNDPNPEEEHESKAGPGEVG